MQSHFMCRINFAKLPPGLKERKEKFEGIENLKTISVLKSEYPINQKITYLEALNQIVSDLTD